MAIDTNGNQDGRPTTPAREQARSFHADGHPKMSAVILALAEPLLEKYGTDSKRVESIIALAMAAWNKAMFPAEAQNGFEKAVLDVAVPTGENAEFVGTAIEIMDMIEDRRQELFPDLRAIITKYDLQVTGEKLTLNVDSAPIAAGSCGTKQG